MAAGDAAATVAGVVVGVAGIAAGAAAVVGVAVTAAIEAIEAIAGKQQNGVELLRGLRALAPRARSPFPFCVSYRNEIHSLTEFFLDNPERCVYYPREFA